MNMKKTYKNINRNRSFLNHIRNNKSINNLVTPEILVDQIWMQEEETKGVKIIELHSSSNSSNDSSKNCNHTWSYVNNGQYKQDDGDEIEEDNRSVNEEARRRRRISMNHSNAYAAAYANQCYYDPGIESNSSSIYEPYNAEYNAATISHHRPMNCFTIINNNQNIKSDSSTDNENYEGIEIIELDNEEDRKQWEQMNNDEVITYEPNMPQETRTIWIYSYKNKRLLSENDFELVNIPSKDASNTSTSCSISDEELKIDDNTPSRRLGSPIPAAFIPRLDLSLVQTLSTVTEISEPNKSYSKESSQEFVSIKQRNNWLSERNEKFQKIENSCVVNWMALSPRERRRRSINTNSDIIGVQNVVEREMTHAEGRTQLELSSDSCQVKSSNVQVQADIHTNETKASKKISTHRSTNESKHVDNKISVIIPMKISFADADEDTEHDNTELNYSNRPSISLSSKFNKTEISDPIEKLDSSNWITEEKAEKETTVYDYDLEAAENVNPSVSSSDNVMVDSASTRLWMRNLRLMKPPQWAEYLPITDSPPSLHLSLSLDSLNNKKSWFKRLTKCIKCCK